MNKKLSSLSIVGTVLLGFQVARACFFDNAPFECKEAGWTVNWIPLAYDCKVWSSGTANQCVGVAPNAVPVRIVWQLLCHVATSSGSAAPMACRTPTRR